MAIRAVYIGLGFLFVGLGAVGTVVPVLPATPFLLLALFFFARGSDRFKRWFESTKLYRNHLHRFVVSRAMTFRAKAVTLGFASAMLAAAFLLADSVYLRALILLVAAYKYYYFAVKITTIGTGSAEGATMEEVSTNEPSARKKRSSGMVNGRLLQLVDHSRRYMAGTIAVNWLGLLCNMAVILAFALLLQRVYEGHMNARQAAVASVVVAVAVAVRLACSWFATMLSYQAAAHAKKSLRSQIYRKLLRLGSAYTGRTSTAGAVQMSVEGVEQLEHYFAKFLPQLFYSLLAPITLFIALSLVSLKSALILLVCVPLIPISIVVIMRVAKRLFRKYWGIYVNLGGSFLENLHGLTTFKIYDVDKQRHEQMNEAAERFRKATMKVLTMQLNSVAVMDLIAFGGAGLGIGVAAHEFAAGRVELWGALTIVLLSAEFFIPLRQLGSFFHVAMNGMAASDKMFELLDLAEAARGKEHIGRSDIRLSDVSFGYEPGREVLRKVTLDVPEGSLVSIVGESGSGKSTIAALMMGSAGSYEGGVTIGGTEVSAIAEKNRMRDMVWLGSNSYIFSGTVEDNLRMGAPAATEEELWHALEQVKLREFVQAQGGLACRLTDQGANLSGGQRQRLALARALLHDSDIYIFDEATSNIDVESESSIMAVIHALAGEKTVVFISHRLANVVKSDCIHVLSGRTVAESGTHEDLLRLGGCYARLYRSQAGFEQFASGGGGHV